jgi:hypothetical protein
MPSLFAYECVNPNGARAEAAEKIISVISVFGANLSRASLSIAGKGSVATGSLARLLDRTRDLESSWSISLVDAKRKFQGRLFSTHMTWVELKMWNSFAAVYLYGDEFSSLCDPSMPDRTFLSSIADILGDGFGYATTFSEPDAAREYALDLRIMRHTDEWAAVVAVKPPGWIEHIRQSHTMATPRGIFALNIWPVGFMETVKQDVKASEAQMAYLSPGMVAIGGAQTEVARLRHLLADRVFEKPRN